MADEELGNGEEVQVKVYIDTIPHRDKSGITVWPFEDPQTFQKVAERSFYAILPDKMGPENLAIELLTDNPSRESGFYALQKGYISQDSPQRFWRESPIPLKPFQLPPRETALSDLFSSSFSQMFRTGYHLPRRGRVRHDATREEPEEPWETAITIEEEPIKTEQEQHQKPWFRTRLRNLAQPIYSALNLAGGATTILALSVLFAYSDNLQFSNRALAPETDWEGSAQVIQQGAKAVHKDIEREGKKDGRNWLTGARYLARLTHEATVKLRKQIVETAQYTPEQPQKRTASDPLFSVIEKSLEGYQPLPPRQKTQPFDYNEILIGEGEFEDLSNIIRLEDTTQERTIDYFPPQEEPLQTGAACALLRIIAMEQGVSPLDLYPSSLEETPFLTNNPLHAREASHIRLLQDGTLLGRLDAPELPSHELYFPVFETKPLEFTINLNQRSIGYELSL